MRIYKWTMGLAGVGVVSLASVARADETNFVQTTLASTMISGYVDTSMEWDPGTGNEVVPGYSYNAGKQDGFNLNSVVVRISRPEGSEDWAAGYEIDLMFGPDNPWGSSSFGSNGVPFRQAYVTLHTPVGNGIDWKLGLFDSIMGFESNEDPGNSNYSRSYGYTIEPTGQTGLTATYSVNSQITVTAGIANTLLSAVNGRANPPKAESYKSYMIAGTWTAPTNMAWFSGSAITAGFINGWDSTVDTALGLEGAAQQNIYVGGTVNTPSPALKFGASYDYAGIRNSSYSPAPGAATITVPHGWGQAADIYSTWQACDRMSFNTRAEYFWQTHSTSPLGGTPNSTPPLAGSPLAGYPATGPGFQPDKIIALTETVQYDLWKNVLTRLEFRWDHQAGGLANGSPNGAWGGNESNPTSPPGKRNWYDFVANVIYKF